MRDVMFVQNLLTTIIEVHAHLNLEIRKIWICPELYMRLQWELHRQAMTWNTTDPSYRIDLPSPAEYRGIPLSRTTFPDRHETISVEIHETGEHLGCRDAVESW